jgi:uncharacterized protein with NAD-binding domain and iron-sulfur cluster
MTATRRVLILGGGCGGVAAAWALSRTPELRRRFTITLVQSGWRLGGKGATGRDPARGHAVLEHGLHLWLGFYRSAFTMLRDLYDNWTRAPAGPLGRLDGAFTPIHEVVLLGQTPEGAPQRWRLRLPELPGRPWDTSDEPLRLSVAARWAGALPSLIVEAEPGGRVLAAQLAATLVRGLARDQLRWGAQAWERMDEEDLRAWLRRHGASEAEACAPPIAALYDLGFAYPDGHAGCDRGSAAAGVAVNVLLRMFAGYRGAPFWRMAAGMGDTVFVPAWDVLRERGVRFELFRHLTHLRVRERAIAEVVLAVQAHGSESYDPLIEVGSLRAWPSAPLRERLADLVDGELDGDHSDALETVTLAHERDFDEVILAIPATAQHRFAAELIAANHRYAAMLEHSHAVATVAAQLWLTRTPTQLGWRGPAAIVTGANGTLRTWADMSEILDVETWPERPAGLAYLCGVAPPELAGLDRQAASAAIQARLRGWVADAASMWPGASTTAANFDEAILHAGEGRDPWRTAYVRANVADWERYVLSLPGTIRHRLAPDESGFRNLYLAGDWTRNVINGGSVEAAVASGVAAATSIISGRKPPG